jgi:hypothetical protein
MTAAPAGMWFPLPPHGGIVCSAGRRQGPSPWVHGSPPSGRSTLTPPASAGKSSAMRWEGEECARITRGPITLSKVAADRTDPVYQGKFSGWF